MLKILKLPWTAVRWSFALLFPMFAGATALGGSGAAGHWLGRIALLGGILGGLTALNNWSYLNFNAVVTSLYPINKIWLPLFALCSYILTWLVWWFWRVLNYDVQPVSQFPDIDSAWSRALEALSKAGISLENTPLFLVLGHSESSEDALYQAGGIRPLVNQVPRESAAPIHVTATRDGIWITCPGASVSGYRDEAPSEYSSAAYGDVDDGGNDDGTFGADRTTGITDILEVISKHQERATANRRQVDIEPLKERLAYLCQLIMRDRGGYCPINGVLLLVPITAADQKNSPASYATVCRTDLAIAFGRFQMRCPILVLVTDLDKLPGFVEMRERLSNEEAVRRMGQRFPLVPDLPPSDVEAQIRSGVAYLGQTLLPVLIHTKFRTEMPGGEDTQDAVQGNSAIFRFLAAFCEREERLGQIIAGCFSAPPGEPLLYGGCYLAGTGTDASTQQAFANGVFKRLIKDQDLVTWTGDAIDEDQRYAKLAKVMTIVLASLIALGVLGGAGLVASRMFGPQQENSAL